MGVGGVPQQDGRPHHHWEHHSVCLLLLGRVLATPRSHRPHSKGGLWPLVLDEEAEAGHTGGKAQSWDVGPQQCLSDLAASSLSSALE